MRARGRLALVLASLLALLAAACSAEASHGCGEGLEAIEAPTTAHSDAPPFRVLWLGDTLLADAAEPRLAANGYAWAFARLLPLPEADAVIVNAEGPITTETAVYDTTQQWTYNAQPEAARALADLGVTAAGLGNNHALDRGPAGLTDTRTHLEAAGVAVIGAGADLDEALRPLLLDTPHGTIGVVAFGQGESARKNAAVDQPGGAFVTPCNLREGALLAREAGARWVVGFVHWGSNYAAVQRTQTRQAALFAEAGYDLVIGHGSHVAQPIGMAGGIPVVYSLGNFVFGTPGRFSAAFPGIGLMATTEFGPDGLEALRLRCILTDNDEVRFQPRPCDADRADAALRALHPGIVVEGGEGVLRWPIE